MQGHNPVDAVLADTEHKVKPQSKHGMPRSTASTVGKPVHQCNVFSDAGACVSA